ncbi:LysR substrate-binding domain-containing protein [Aquabacterium sp. A7-Y]|uniref:LysR family transcriptional regulator n=1 Tax=Aquabacterium sp. A7-Y TaxID=1349605 RepID=UPI00223CC7A3|nr:LysR family transcriptional regulator [Aquabacterium sp. A7-Y]MCW7538436.1 LysR substrate-binding domain-containing protein [Aquabacterium sp. A7-Y]
MDKFAAMTTFVRVVEAGTLTKAADSMGVGAPAVTRLINQLEAALQVKLLVRTTRRVTVTPAGAEYYERARRVLSDVDHLESMLLQSKTKPRGRVRVDAPALLTHAVLIPALPDFHARFPDIQLDLGVSDRSVDALQEGVDCVVRGGQPTHPEMASRRIGEAAVLAVAAPDYLARHGVPKHPRDLEAGHRVVSYFPSRQRRPLPFDFTRGDERIEVQGSYSVCFDDTHACLIATLNGLGVTLAFRFLAEPHLRTGALRPLLLDWTSDPVPLYAAYPRNRHLSQRVRVFIDWIVELMQREGLNGAGGSAP